MDPQIERMTQIIGEYEELIQSGQLSEGGGGVKTPCPFFVRSLCLLSIWITSIGLPMQEILARLWRSYLARDTQKFCQDLESFADGSHSISARLFVLEILKVLARHSRFTVKDSLTLWIPGVAPTTSDAAQLLRYEVVCVSLSGPKALAQQRSARCLASRIEKLLAQA